MSTTIRVSEENWERLNSRKSPGEDFNDVVERLLDNQEELDELQRRIAELESRFNRHIEKNINDA